MRLLHSSQVSPAALDSRVQSIIRSISEHGLREWVRKISVPRHFRAQQQHNESTARWLAAQLTDWGYHVELQGPYRNVVAWPRNQAKVMTLVGAHYDSVPETPGADDNGSAVAAMLGCAEACAKFAQPPPVCFAAFNCEEDGMAGSRDFVVNHLPSAGIQITRAHILEMVGFTNLAPGSQRLPTGLPIRIPEAGDFLGLLADGKSGPMMDTILAHARAYLPEFSVLGLEVPVGAERALPVLARSDHLPFWQRAIPAVMWTDTSEFRNPHYHLATDTPETLDYGFLLLVTQLLTACVCSKAV